MTNYDYNFFDDLYDELFDKVFDQLCYELFDEFFEESFDELCKGLSDELCDELCCERCGEIGDKLLYEAFTLLFGQTNRSAQHRNINIVQVKPKVIKASKTSLLRVRSLQNDASNGFVKTRPITI